MEVYTSIDWVSYKEKPTNEIPGIRRRMTGNWISIDVRELAEKVGDGGHTIVPGHLEGGIKAENCTEMQLLVLDFDDGVTFGEILGRCNGFGIPITFAYHTFSSTKEKEKFRVVFVYQEVLKDTFVIQMLLAMLYRIFPECDKSCKNLDRVFLGGKELIYLNENARISLV